MENAYDLVKLITEIASIENLNDIQRGALVITHLWDEIHGSQLQSGITPEATLQALLLVDNCVTAIRLVEGNFYSPSALIANQGKVWINAMNVPLFENEYQPVAGGTPHIPGTPVLDPF